MNKELKRLVVEIISLVLLLVIVIPICVNASDDYKEKKELFASRVGTSVDITNNGELKKVTIYSNYDKVIRINLIMKISRFSNNYEIYLDGKVYNINDFNYIEDNEYRYYKLGIYEINRVREFDFKLNTSGKVYYDEVITYGFMTEGLL